MNREGAIKVLRTESIELGGSVPSVCRFLEALDMAVKALEDVTDKNVGKMTNADRIRAMTDEELALWICGVYDIEEEHGKFINGIIIPGYAPHDIEEWLQMPAEDDHDERKENENVRR